MLTKMQDKTASRTSRARWSYVCQRRPETKTTSNVILQPRCPRLASLDHAMLPKSEWRAGILAIGMSTMAACDDVQFAFAYFHWLILSSRHLDFEIEQFFSDVVDTNQDGHVSENEMRTIAAIVAGGAPSERDLEDTKECLAPKRTTQKEWADDAGTFPSIYGNIDL